MTPFGSLSFFVHLAIVFIVALWRILTTKPLSVAIIIAVFLVTFYSTHTALGVARNQGLGLYDYGSKILFPCRAPQVADTKQVIIRIDEVQAFWLRETTLQIANVAAETDVPLVFGVIPKNILEDTKLVTFLQRSRCHIEIAQNGWDYSSQVKDGVALVEFQGLEQEAAFLRIESGKSMLKSMTGLAPLTFIPPHNIYSEGTALALKQADIPIISSQGSWKYDYSVVPFRENEMAPLPFSEVLNQCKKNFSDKKPCVILFSPKNFSDLEGVSSPDKIAYFRGLIVYLTDAGVNFTTFERAENF